MVLKSMLRFCPICVFSFLTIIFLGERILVTGDTFIGGIDIAEYFYWHATFIKQQFLSGQIPLWNPHYYSGHPFLANPQSFIMYPSTLLYVLFSLPWAFNIDTVAHILLACLGIFSLVHLITGSRTAGIASGIIYGFSGYFMDNIFAGHLTMVHTAALLPWVFYFIEKGIRGRIFHSFLAAGLVFGLQILGGEPQNSYYTAVFLTLYFAVRVACTYKEARANVRAWTFCYAIIPVAAFGISAIQFLPSLEFMLYSDRAKNTYEFVTFMSFPLENFFTFFVPKIQSSMINTNWEYSGYVGVLALFLAFFGIFRHEQRECVWCLLAMILFAVTVMLGKNTPLYALYYQFVPGIKAFRIPARCVVIVVFSVSILAGLGIDSLLRTTLNRKTHYVATGGIAILVIVLITIVQYYHVPLSSKEIVVALGLIAGTLVVYGASVMPRQRDVLRVLVIAVLFLDPYVIYSSQTPLLDVNKLSLKQGYEDIFTRDNNLYRVSVPFGTLRGMGYNYQGINGYTPIVIDDYYKFVHAMAGIPIPIERRHTLSPSLYSADNAFSSRILGVKYAVVKTSAGLRMLSIAEYQPRAVLLNEVAYACALEDHIELLRDKTFNPRKTVIFEEAQRHRMETLLGDKGSDADYQGMLSITRYSPNTIELNGVSSSDAILVLNELFYPGWKAYVDGARVDILRADYVLRGVIFPSGAHRVTFVYRPLSFLVGAIISLAVLLSVLSLYVYKKKRDIHGIISMT